MFKFFKRRGNLRDDNASDIITESHTINTSDSAPILNRNYDLSQQPGLSSVYHDLRQTTDLDVSTVKRSLRTISGVFCPVSLSMCSVAVFMRIGYIVGNAGFYQSIGLYALAFSIFVLTGLSVCAISTNGAIQGGGVYYMISRALGPEFGGSIGVLFFIANALGSAFNASALVEKFVNLFGESAISGGVPDTRWFKFLYGSILNFLTLIICLLGANLFSYAVTFIYMIMVAIYITVVLSVFITSPKDIPLPGLVNETARFTGLSSETFKQNLFSNYTVDYTTGAETSFAHVFGVLFSSLTGIMAGANMSGELKKPARSIPLGTMSAVLFVFLVYFSENILLAASCEQKLLVYNYQVMQDISFWKPLIPIGVLSTTFSGELSSLIGSSRVLKALADDEIFGSVLHFVKIGKTKSGNPYVAVICTFLLAQVVLLVPSVNSIAPLVTIFYLLAYFGVNLSCMALDLASAPNFRPTFKYFSWHTAMVGMFGTITMTFIVSPVYASVAISLLIILIIVLYMRDFPSEWGSISQALIFHQVRKYLLMLDTRKDHVKFWRPQILLLIANPRSCLPLIDFGNDVKKGGLFVLGNVRVGKLDSFDEDPCQRELPAWMNLVDNLKVKAFIELTLSSSIKEGIHNLIRISGLGGMKPNTVMMGFYDNTLPEDLLHNTQFLRKRRFLNYGINGSSTQSNLNQLNSYMVPQFDALRGPNDSSKPRLDVEDYVDIIRDVLKMKKNLCISRRVNTLRKSHIRSKTAPIYIDVWPLNFLIPELCAQLDSTSLFMLQLACILNMVSVWKSAQLRIFLCTDNLDAQENARRKSRLEDLLNQLRIQAITCLVPIESVKNLLNRPVISDADLPHYQQPVTVPEILNASDIYLRAANTLIRQYSESSDLCFLYLPPPPPTKPQTSPHVSFQQQQADDSPNHSMNLMQTTALIPTSQDTNNEMVNRYMKILETLSENLPPCMFVNGVSCVTSTHL